MSQTPSGGKLVNDEAKYGKLIVERIAYDNECNGDG